MMGNGTTEGAQLLHKIHDSLGDKITPDQARSLMTLKGMDESSLSFKSSLKKDVLESWLHGDMPILPGRKIDLVELVLGVERGAFTSDRIHVLHLDETKWGKDKLVKMLDDVMPFLVDGVRSQVVGMDGKEKWAGSARIHAVRMPDDQKVFIRHIQKRFLGGRAVNKKLQEIREEVVYKPGSRSEFLISEDLAKGLASSPLQNGENTDNTTICETLSLEFEESQAQFSDEPLNLATQEE